jgi:hypothetical protein
MRVDNQVVDRCRLDARRVRLRVSVADEGLCRFAFARAGRTGAEWSQLGPAFQATVGRWIGAKVGLFARRSPGSVGQSCADFAYFRFSEGC